MTFFLHHFIAKAEVYKNEGNEAYLKEDYVSAVYFYTEGIKVNCKDQELNGKLYSNRAYANLRLGKSICKFQIMVRHAAWNPDELGLNRPCLACITFIIYPSAKKEIIKHEVGKSSTDHAR